MLGVVFSIDATYSGGLGRMVNDSKSGNSVMKKVIVDGKEHLCLFATCMISPGDQLLYNYGDESGRLFWRNKVSYNLRMINNKCVLTRLSYDVLVVCVTV
jgi:SET domain-containing protein